MPTIDDGGPAFPMPIAANLDGFGTTDEYVGGDGKSGMSLRDWFAGQALAGMMSTEAGWDRSASEVASEAVAQADALLAELKKGGA